MIPSGPWQRYIIYSLSDRAHTSLSISDGLTDSILLLYMQCGDMEEGGYRQERDKDIVLILYCDRFISVPLLNGSFTDVL